MRRLTAGALVAAMTCLGSTGASAWWDDDDYHDRWYGGPWYGGYPGYGYGWGYPGYGWGYPGYGWGYPGYGGEGYRSPSTIIVNPPQSPTPPEPEPQLPR